MLRHLLLTTLLSAYADVGSVTTPQVLYQTLEANNQLITDTTGSLALGTACSLGDVGDVCIGEDLHVAGNITGANGATWENSVNNATTRGENSETLTETWSSNAVALSSATGVTSYGFGTITPTVAARTKRIPIEVGSLILTGTAPPTIANCGVGACLVYATDADDITYLSFFVPTDWDGASDILLIVRWAATSGDPLALSETVTWQIDWRSPALGAEFNAGTAVSLSVTYTETDNPDSERETKETTLTLDFDGANQPIAHGDMIGVTLRRDVDTDNYSGGVNLLALRAHYTSTSLVGD